MGLYIDTYIRKISTKNMRLNLYMSEKYIAIDVLSLKSYYLANICMFPKTKQQLYYSTALRTVMDPAIQKPADAYTDVAMDG
jgi:hypothetical protein